MEFSGRRSAGWRGIIALIVLVAILIAYYWAHKPLDPTLIASLGGGMLDVFTIGLLGVVSGGFGRRLYHYLSGDLISELSVAEQVGIQGLLGLGVVGWLALLLGLLGLYTRPALWGMLLVIAIISVRQDFGWLRDLLQLGRSAFHTDSAWTRFLSITVLFLLTLALIQSLAPPTAFDSLNYHLVGPTRYLAAGRITPQPDNHFLGFPQGVEILYGVVISLFGRDTTAAPLHWLIGLMGLLVVAGLVRRFTSTAVAWLSLALLMGALSIWLLFGWPYIDLGMMAYGAAALVAAVTWREGQDTRWLVLMGLFGGMALGVKYTGAGLLLALGVFVVFTAPRQAIRNGLILGLVALLAFLPWAIKGALLYQNPVYPFVFGGLNWDAGRANTFSTTGTGLLGSSDAWQLIVLPIAATVFGVEKGDGFSFTASPWLLTAPLLLLIVWNWLDDRARRLARVCILLALPMIAFWLVLAALSSIGVQTRLMMMAMPVFAVLGALGFYGLSRLPRKPLDVYFVARALLVLTLVFTLLDAVRDTLRTGILPYLMGQTSRADYLTANLGIYINAMRQLDDLPEGSTVRLMFEPRAYYCPPTVTCIPDILFDHWPRALRQGKTPDEVFMGWEDAGDDYILLFDLGYQFNAQDSRFIDENAQFPAALERWMTPIWSDDVGGYTLYTWKPNT